MTDPALFDPGTQPERTGLAWRRTLLTLLAVALAGLRLLPAALGPWGLGAALAVLVLTATLWVLGERRFRRMRRTLLASSGPLPGGGLLLAVAVTVAATGAAGLLTVVLIHPGPG